MELTITKSNHAALRASPHNTLELLKRLDQDDTQNWGIHDAAIRRVLDSQLTGWENRRAILGMSKIGYCPRRLYWETLQGRNPPKFPGLRLCHEGLLHESDVIARLDAAGLTVENQQTEITSFDRRFVGHIDGSVKGTLIEIKTVKQIGHLLQFQKTGITRIIRAQVQCYMHYSQFRSTWVIVKSRDIGALWVFSEKYDPDLAEQLEQKAQLILESIDRRKPPTCTCNRCER